MKIYSMTATFGKLEHETLTLQPGLNIIEAPNEWGKSTWCAFLVNMLYGLDTRAKTTKTSLAEKERYAPWSGSAMAGRIDLCWNGRDITIERHTRGRLIFGEFRAYETATGIDVPELNGTNCGSMLLGVERSVFTRAGFLKLTDLPVTQDEALRRRLNSLVTTGDESGAADQLQKALKDLKNKCRYNRSGLLPQAEAQKEQLEGQLNELDHLTQQSESLHIRQKELEERVTMLENHKAALRYAAAQSDIQKVAQALQEKEKAEKICADLMENCKGLPSSQEAEEAIQTGQRLQQQWMSLQMESQLLPPLPEEPQVPKHYGHITPADVVQEAKADLQKLTDLERQRKKRNIIVSSVFCIAALACIAMAVLRLAFSYNNPVLYIGTGAATAITAILTICICTVRTRHWWERVEALYDRHPNLSPNLWVTDAETFFVKQQAYTDALTAAHTLRGNLDERIKSLSVQISDFTKGESLTESLGQWQQIRAAWNALGDATRDLRQAESHAQTLQSMAKTAEPPGFPDALTYSESETDAFLNSARFELRQLQQKLGQCQGRSEALGQESTLRTQLKTLNRRIHKLEDTYAALELAQKALSAATTELQRRFAPRISKRAQELFAKLTDGRYERLMLSEDLSLNVCTQEEDILRSSQWRSDGTIDQLYLALRLAVAEELTPQAPLILDDALVRFDDNRLAAAMDILRQTAQNKQVILFTCQGRERKL